MSGDKNGAGAGGPQNCAAMKLPVATLLLLLATGRLGAALVRRDVASEGSQPAAGEDFFTHHFQSFSDFITRELPQKLRAEELRSQAEQYLDRANKQLEPLARELQNNVLGLFSSLLRLGKDEGQGGSP